MPGMTFTARELAEELGRKESWLHDGWRQLVTDQRMPAPLMGGARPLTWSRAQIYAWLDAKLPAAQRSYAAAFRAALDAAAGAGSLEAVTVAESRSRLDARFPLHETSRIHAPVAKGGQPKAPAPVGTGQPKAQQA